MNNLQTQDLRNELPASGLEVHGAVLGRTSNSHWFALRTRFQHEKTIANVLSDIGVACYLPLTSEVRQWSDRKQTVQLPLLSGYLFVQMDLQKESRIPVLKIPGVLSFVGNQGGPVAIPEVQIQNIRTVLNQRIPCEVLPSFQEGDRVRVVRGPLQGIEGTMVSSYSKTRLLISIDLIQKTLSVSVPRQDVEPVCISVI